MKTLNTKRLVLNKIELSDFNEYYAIASNPNITTGFMLDMCETLVEAKSAVEEIINSYENNEYYFWAIRLDGKMIGIVKCEEADYLEIGYAINEDYQNNGYATESLIAVTNYFKEIARIKRIILGAFEDNIASIKVMKKAGYSYLAIEKNAFFYKGISRNIIYYQIDFE